MTELAASFQFIETNGIRLHCAIAGENNRSNGTIILLHGFPEFWYCWRHQIADLSRNWRVVAPDMRGFNLSAKPEGVAQYSMKKVVADIAGLILSLGDEPVTLVGHDWGGAVAWPVAAHHSQLINKLIILNGPHPTVYMREIIHNPAQRLASQYILKFREPEAEAWLSADNYSRLLRIACVAPENAAKYVEAWSQPGALTGGLNYYRAMQVPPPLPDAQVGEVDLPELNISVPTLVIWGEQDKAVLTGNLEGLDRYVENLTIHRIPHASHWVQQDAPDEVNLAIRRFLIDSQ